MKRDGAHGKDTTTRELEISLLLGLRLAESEHRLRHAAMASAVSNAKHYGLDAGTIVSENVRNGYCTYGFRRIKKQLFLKLLKTIVFSLALC